MRIRNTYHITKKYQKLLERHITKYFPGEERTLLERYSFLGKLIDFSKPWVAKVMYKVYIPYAKKVEKRKTNGKWYMLD